MEADRRPLDPIAIADALRGVRPAERRPDDQLRIDGVVAQALGRVSHLMPQARQ